jgi:cytochrome P450
MMSQYVVHHAPKYFPEPEVFKPERWTSEFKNSLPKGAYFPFGAGPRGCIGEPLAWMEAVIVIATIAQTWRLKYAGNPPPKLNVRFNLPPRYVLVRVPRPEDEMPMRTSMRSNH